MNPLRTFDWRLGHLGRSAILALSASGVVIVGVVDYLTGYEVSFSLFYLGPVAVAAWYAGRWTGVAVAAVSCVSWYVADMAAGNQYSHPAIPVWNALVRLGLFLITAFLLTALRNSLLSHRHLARTDVLTELYNRRAFEQRLQHDLALAQRHKSALTLAYVDLDDFKAVNDTRGHAEGDKALRTVGRLLKSLVREADTAARIGGDEFALVLPDTDSSGARQIISKVRGDLQEAFAAGKWRVTCSIGVITLQDPAMSLERAVAAADELMYEVKRKGKDAVAFSVLGEAVQPSAAADAMKRRR